MMTTAQRAPLEAPFTMLVLGDWSQLDLEHINTLTAQIRAIKAHCITTLLGQDAFTATMQTLDEILVGLYVAHDILAGRDYQRQAAFYETLARAQTSLLNEWPRLQISFDASDCQKIEEEASCQALISNGKVDISQGAAVIETLPQGQQARSSYTLTDEIAEHIRRFTGKIPLRKWGATKKLAEELGVPPRIALRWATHIGCYQPIPRQRRKRKDLETDKQEESTNNQEAKARLHHSDTRSPPCPALVGDSMIRRRSSGRRTSLLSAEDERALAAQIQAGGEEAKRARERFIEANQGLVFRIARKYARFNEASVALEDLVQEGNLGLLRAITSFDPDKGRFSTHATWWIKQAIIRACEEKSGNIRIPSYVHQLHNRVKRIRQRLVGTLAQEPSIDAIAHEAQVSVSQVMRIQHVPMTISLEQSLVGVNDDDDRSVGELIADGSTPEEVVVGSLFAEEVRNVLKKVLTPREFEIIELRYGLGLDEEQALAQIGRKLSITRGCWTYIRTTGVTNYHCRF